MLDLKFPLENEIPEDFRLSGPVRQTTYLCDGEMRSWTGKSHEVFSPVCVEKPSGLTRVLVGSYPICTAKEAMIALDAAEKAYNNGRGIWPTMSVGDRIKCIEKFTHRMIEKKEEVAKLIMWEIGKSYTDSIKEFDRTVEYIYATVDALKDLDRQSSGFQIVDGIAAQVRRSPLGVVLCMGPFNYPLNETYTTLIPALIMGNTVLFKPPKHGSLLHFPLLEAFGECFPKGVVNSVYGRGADIIPPLMESGRINVLTLIGSSKVADQLKKLHPKVNRLRAILGLDAKNAAIVTANSDLDLAVKECVMGSLSFNGQRCTAIKIIFVHKSVVAKFNEKLSEAVSQLIVGMPWVKGVNITPLPEPQKPTYLRECLDDAEKHGGKVINPNGGVQNESFCYPAIVYPVNSKMKLYREEQFGPIIPVLHFEDIEEPIQYLIESPHGQQVSLFSSDSEELASLIDPLVNQVSRVNINSQCQRGPDVFPFTGRKDSAEGTLSVSDALRSFSIRSLVAAKLTEGNKHLLNEIITGQESNFLSTKFIF